MNNSSTRNRVLAGVLANTLGRFWVIAVQIVSVPVLVASWGAREYGIWLMLTAIPTYIALSDFGFGAAAAVEMTKRIIDGDRPGALRSLQSVWVLVTGATLLIAAIAAGVYLLTAYQLIPIRIPLDHLELTRTATVMCIFAVLAVQMSFLNSVYRSAGRYALGTLLLEFQLPLEGGAVLLTALGGGGILAAAIAALTMRAVGLTSYILILRRVEPWLTIGVDHARWSEIRRLAKPALASMNLSVSQALSIQGALLTLGIFASPVATATFGTARTLMRAPLQFVSLITRATLPELTAAAARSDRSLMTRLTLANLVSAPLVFVPAGFCLVTLGPWAVKLLSHGKILASRELFWWLSGTLALQATWNALGQVLVATNQHHKLSNWYIILSIALVASPAIGTREHIAERTAAVSMCIEGIMLARCYFAWRRNYRLALGDFSEALNFVRNRLDFGVKRIASALAVRERG